MSLSRKTLPLVLALTLSLPYAPFALSGGGGFSGATEWTQLANNAELMAIFGQNVEQVANQLVQIDHQLKMLERMSNFSSWEDMIPIINQVANALSETYDGQQGVLITAGNVNDRFKTMYPNEYDPITYEETRQDIEQMRARKLAVTQSTLSVAGLHMDDMADEGQRLNVLKGLSENPVGQTQALQAIAQINAMNVEQLQKMRQMQLAQVQMAANIEAERVQREAMAEAIADSVFENPDIRAASGRSYQSLWR